jgi:hypothetical protein
MQSAKYLSLAACLLLPSIVCALEPGADTNAAPRGVTVQCAKYRGGNCRMPFDVALAYANEIAATGVKVQLRGFLVRDGERFVLYRDFESAQRGWRTDGLVVSAMPAEIQSSLERRNQSLVEINGSISLETPEGEEYWATVVIDRRVALAGIRGESLKPTRHGR